MTSGDVSAESFVREALMRLIAGLPLLGSLTLCSRLSICGSRQHIQFRPIDNNRELHTEIPDGFKETIPLLGITTEKSFLVKQ